jgi:hypothetical protein
VNYLGVQKCIDIAAPIWYPWYMPRIDTPSTVAARFWPKVDIGEPDRCWPWKGSKMGRGYGKAWVNERYIGAHRIAWGLTNGEMPPDDMMVLHSCDNPICVNPSHLRVGTHQHNMDDKEARGRHLKGERSPNAKLSEADVLEIRSMWERHVPQQTIASCFGVKQSHVSNIVRRKRWTWLPSPLEP